MSKVYIFRGSPSSGKGTITKAFAKELSGKVARIELDDFRWGFHLLDRNVSDVGNEEHGLAYKNYLSVLENYFKDGSYTIITEGLFSWNTPGPHGNMQDIIKLCKKYNQEYYPILLYADKEVLWERNNQREYSVPREEFDELYGFVMGNRSESETALNVSELPVEETVERLLALTQ